MAQSKRDRDARAGNPLPYPSVSPADGTIVPLVFPTLTPESTLSELFIAAINSSGELVSKNQTKPNGPFGGSWTPVTSTRFDGPLDAATTLDGRVAIIATEASQHHVLYIAEAENGGSGSSRWMPPEDLGLPPGVSSLAQLALTRGVNGRDNVFASTAQNTKASLWWKYRNPPVIVTKQEQVTPPGSTTPITVTVQVEQPPAQPWSDWINFNGDLEGYLLDLKAASNADGRIVVTGIYSNGIPWVRQQTSENPFGQEVWGDWTVPGAPVDETAGYMTPVLDSEGTVSVFASTNDGILRSRQREPGGADWSGWSAPGQINDNVANHAVSINADGHLYVVTANYPPQGSKTILYGIKQTSAKTNTWTAWQRLNALADVKALSLDYNADGTLNLFAFDTSGTLWTISQICPDSTEWYLTWENLGGGLKSYAITRDMTPNS